MCPNFNPPLAPHPFSKCSNFQIINCHKSSSHEWYLPKSIFQVIHQNRNYYHGKWQILLPIFVEQLHQSHRGKNHSRDFLGHSPRGKIFRSWHQILNTKIHAFRQNLSLAYNTFLQKKVGHIWMTDWYFFTCLSKTFICQLPSVLGVGVHFWANLLFLESLINCKSTQGNRIEMQGCI